MLSCVILEFYSYTIAITRYIKFKLGTVHINIFKKLFLYIRYKVLQWFSRKWSLFSLSGNTNFLWFFIKLSFFQGAEKCFAAESAESKRYVKMEVFNENEDIKNIFTYEGEMPEAMEGKL